MGKKTVDLKNMDLQLFPEQKINKTRENSTHPDLGTGLNNYHKIGWDAVFIGRTRAVFIGWARGFVGRARGFDLMNIPS